MVVSEKAKLSCLMYAFSQNDDKVLSQRSVVRHSFAQMNRNGSPTFLHSYIFRYSHHSSAEYGHAYFIRNGVKYHTPPSGHSVELARGRGKTRGTKEPARTPFDTTVRYRVAGISSMCRRRPKSPTPFWERTGRPTRRGGKWAPGRSDAAQHFLYLLSRGMILLPICSRQRQQQLAFCTAKVR